MTSDISLFVYTNTHLNCIFFSFGFIKFNSNTGFAAYATEVLCVKIISAHSQSVLQENA